VFDVVSFSGRSVVIRGVGPGDRIAMREGRKRVSDALSEARIPADERDGWPVLEVDGRVAWIPGVRRAYTGWVNDDTMGHVVASVAREEMWKPVGY
jgi:tRNA(Ile)-lysidine synthetase-like protein